MSMQDLPTPELPIMRILRSCESLGWGWITCLACYIAFLNIVKPDCLNIALRVEATNLVLI
jgi:hypothetical protein